MASGTLENFGFDYPIAIVTAGGTTTSDTTWTVATTTPFPVAGAGPPALQFHVADPALPQETIAVTSVSGNTWTVVRASEGSTALQHAANFTVKQVVSGVNGFASFYQLAGQGPTSVTTISNSATASVITGIYVPSSGTLPGGAGAGVVYELQAWGTFTNHSELASGSATLSVFWDTATGTALASIIPGVTTAAFANSSGTVYPVYINAVVSFQNATHATAMLQMLWRNSNTVATASTQAVSVGAQTTVNGTSGAAQQLCLVWKWTTAETTNVVNAWGLANQIQ